VPRAHYSFLVVEVVALPASPALRSRSLLYRFGHTIKASKSPFPAVTLKIRLVLIIAPKRPSQQRTPLRQQPIQS